MSFSTHERDRPYGAVPLLYQQQLRAMHHVNQMTSNAGFTGAAGDAVAMQDAGNHSYHPSHFESSRYYQSMYDNYDEPVGYSSPYTFQAPERASPQSSITTSSSTASPVDHYDEDAMVDAAMLESGILTATPMMEDDHFGLDAAMLREMEELLACSREDAIQWNQFHLESPSLEYAKPVAPGSSSTSGATAAKNHEHHHPRDAHVSGDSVASASSWPSQLEDYSEEDAEMEADDEVPPIESRADAREKELMERQLKFLEAQRDFLAYKTAVANTMKDDLSPEELEKREHAAAEGEKLHAAQLQHKLLANVARELQENFKYMELLVLQSPVNNYRMALMTPMECFIHLTKDPAERRATLLALRDSKIDDVMRYINNQSRNIDVERQFFYLDTFEKFGKFYTVDFSISKFDDTTVDEVVGIIYHHFASSNQVISEILGSVENREYFDGVPDCFLHARFVDRIALPPRHKGDRRFAVQESNGVYYLKKVGEVFVFACDYIDKDELHPYRQTGRIRQDKTIGVIVEPYTDSQGTQTVIMKRFAFIKHHFKNIKPTPDLVQAISTKVILWGQAVRFCLAGHARAKAKNATISPKLVAKSEEVTKLINSKPE